MRSIKKQSLVLLMLGALAAVSNAAKFNHLGEAQSESGIKQKDSMKNQLPASTVSHPFGRATLA